MSKKEWIIKNLYENNMDKQIVYSMFDDYKKEFGSDILQDSFRRLVCHIYETVSDTVDLKDFTEESVMKLEASKQKLQDLNNQVRKTNREQFRIYNNVEEMYTELSSVLENIDLTKFKIKEHKDTSKKVLIAQFSDTHMNRIIERSESNGNCYDFIIASKRLKKYVSKLIQVGKDNKITIMHIFQTGDLLTSNRRLSEQTQQCCSLISASVLATYLFEQAIIELSKYFNITISSVVGNESRLDDFMETTTLMQTQNYDYLIFNNLRMLFSKTPIKFNDDKNISMQVVKVTDNFNALILHGHQLHMPNPDKDIAKLLQTFSYNGVKISGIFYGHYHTPSGSSIFNRSGSMCGSDGYSTELGFLTRASQNYYIVNADGSLDTTIVDLQNTDTIEGYDIKNELERYNVKNSSYNNIVTIKNLV